MKAIGAMAVSMVLFTACGDTGSSVSDSGGGGMASPAAMGGADNQMGGAPQDTMPGSSSIGGVPTRAAEMQAWLVTKDYTMWSGESAVHQSSGPHGQVRTYINSVLESSLAQQNTEHPKGSASVKELYSNGTLSGWAVSVKVKDTGDGGDGWYWYESFSTAEDGPAAFQGTGHPTCVGCHSRSGSDFIATPFPLN